MEILVFINMMSLGSGRVEESRRAAVPDLAASFCIQLSHCACK